MTWDQRDIEHEEFRRRQAVDAAVRLRLLGYHDEARMHERKAAEHAAWAERMRQER